MEEKMLQTLEKTYDNLNSLYDTMEMLAVAFEKKGSELTKNVLTTLSFSVCDIMNELDGSIQRYNVLLNTDLKPESTDKIKEQTCIEG